MFEEDNGLDYLFNASVEEIVNCDELCDSFNCGGEYE